MPNPIRVACMGSCFFASLGVLAEPVLITVPTTIGPTATTITPTGGGAPVTLSAAEVIVQGTTLTINGRHPLRSLELRNNSILNHSAGATFDYSGSGTDIVSGMQLTIAGDARIDDSSRIDVSGAGFPGSTGPGRGATGSGPCGGGGGGHGGAGGRANCTEIFGGSANGSDTEPRSFGSGGGGYPGVTAGGPGGGAVRLVVGGTLHVAGVILANGQGPLNSSGGAGGSVWISATQVTGSGMISASGGAEGTTNQSSGGGGGGRIAITGHCFLAPELVLRAAGGRGPIAPQTGAPGTIVVLPASSGCCPADFNGDGFIDFFDYDAYVNCFETGGCDGATADFNGDGFVDFFDYDAFVAAFEAGC